MSKANTVYRLPPVNTINRIRQRRNPRVHTTQEVILKDWVQGRKRKRRVQIDPWTEMTMEERLEAVRIEGMVDGVGYVIFFICGAFVLALLIYHFNWWTVPALISAGLLGCCLRKFMKW